MLKSLATAIVALLATVFGAHQAAVAISPPQPSPAQVAAVQNAANSAAISSTSSTSTTQHFQDLSSAHSITEAQHSTLNAPTNQPALHSTASNAPLLYATRADLASSTAALNAAFQSQLATLSTVSPATIAALQTQISQTNRISQLPANVVVSGVSGLTSSDIPDLSGKYLSLNGGALTGAFTDTSTASSSFAGSLGIGTTSPSTTFGLNGSQYLTGGLGIGILDTTAGTLQTTGNGIFGGTLALNGTTGTTTIASGQGFTIGTSQFVFQQGSGNVGIGTASPDAPLTINANSSLPAGPLPAGTDLHIVGGPSGTPGRIVVDAWGIDPVVTMRGANGTPAAPTALLNGSPFGTFNARGYGATGYSGGAGGGARAAIGFTAAEDWTDSAQGSYMVFLTTPVGSTTLTEAARASNSGFTVIGGSVASFLTTGAGFLVPVTISSTAASSPVVGLRLSENQNTSNIGIVLENTSANVATGIRTGADGILSFGTGLTAGGTFTGSLIRMAITPLGNVGIGTTNPTGNLSVQNNYGSTNATLFSVASSTAANGSTATNFFTVTSAGNVGIGTTSPTTALQVAGVVTPNADNTSSLGNATYRWSSVFAANGTIQTSDARLKSNVNDLSYGLPDLLKLRPVSFTWTAQPQQGTQLGFIAQEVQPVFPEAVNVGDDANHTLGLTYTEFIPVIVKSIQQIASVGGAFQTNLIAWLGNASNGINDLFAKHIYATNITTNVVNSQQDNTQKLCIGSTCLTEIQLTAILAAAGQTGATQSSSGQGSGTTGGSATSTPDTPPVIEIDGENPASITVGDTYSDLGATITGPQQDLNLGIHVSVDGGATTTPDQVSIDTSTSSTHTISYFAADQNGFTSFANRTVICKLSSEVQQSLDGFRCSFFVSTQST